MKRFVFVSAAVLLLVACSPILKSAGFPPEALRREPPRGIAARAVPVGTAAPALDLPSTREGFRVSTAISAGPVVVVFFRGTW